MKRTETIKINNREIEITELTALQSHQYIENLGKEDAASIIDQFFPESLPGSFIKLSTGLTEDELGEMHLSEIKELIKAVESVNPITASRLAKLAELGKKVMDDPDLLHKLQELNLREAAAA